MARYLLSVFAPAEPGPYGPYPSEEEMLAALDAVDEFNAALQRDGHFVFADGLAPVSTATTVDGQGVKPVLTDGPYAEAKEHLAGFWIVEAEDLDEALRLAAAGSRACRGAVEVRPFAEPPRGGGH